MPTHVSCEFVVALVVVWTSKLVIALVSGSRGHQRALPVVYLGRLKDTLISLMTKWFSRPIPEIVHVACCPRHGGRSCLLRATLQLRPPMINTWLPHTPLLIQGDKSGLTVVQQECNAHNTGRGNLLWATLQIGHVNLQSKASRRCSHCLIDWLCGRRPLLLVAGLLGLLCYSTRRPRHRSAPHPHPTMQCLPGPAGSAANVIVCAFCWYLAVAAAFLGQLRPLLLLLSG